MEAETALPLTTPRSPQQTPQGSEASAMRSQGRSVCRQGAALQAGHVAEVGAAQREEPAGHSCSTGTGQSELSPSGPLSGMGGSSGLRRERLTRRGGISSLRFSTAATVSWLSDVGPQ